LKFEQAGKPYTVYDLHSITINKPSPSWAKRIINAPRFKTTIIAILVGAAIGFAFFYLTEGRLMESMPANDIIKSLLIGGFFGFFITNSPCARGRC
jgi:RsiW-degrading membrane proteinase PrsW (M82 family)